LLIERFGLAVHRETKTIQGFALVIAKNGSKIHLWIAGAFNSHLALSSGTPIRQVPRQAVDGGLVLANRSGT
jgi:uncharacterized protein (TIGR03435 family)